MQMHDERQADAGRHHRESREGIAHHQGEERHAETVGRDHRKRAVYGDETTHQIRHHLPHS